MSLCRELKCLSNNFCVVLRVWFTCYVDGYPKFADIEWRRRNRTTDLTRRSVENGTHALTALG